MASYYAIADLENTVMEPNFNFREIVVIGIGKTLMIMSSRILTKLIGSSLAS